MSSLESTLPLKFKVYHSVRKEMYNVVQVHDGIPSIICKEVGGREVVEMLDPGHAQLLKIVQAVGISDQNRVPVYDGDILLSDHCFYPDSPGVVVFDSGCFYVVYIEKDADDEDGRVFFLSDYNKKTRGRFSVDDNILTAEFEGDGDETDPDT